MKLFDLSGRVAIVTGGNGGIGLGMGRGLAGAGASVMVAGRNKEKNAAAVAELKGLGAQAASVEVDVTEPESCEVMVRSTVAAFDHVDILINSAGIGIRKQPQDYALEEWHQVMDTNLTSAFTCSRAVYPEMCKRGGGKIINIGSML